MIGTRRLGAAEPDALGGFNLQPVEVGADVAQRWLQALDRITGLEQDAFLYVERSFRLFEASLPGGVGPDTVRIDVIVEVVGSVMDWLGSMRTFLAHEERRLKHEAGHAAFAEACTREYDSCFAYRFLYRLRNYAQHLALPVHVLNPSALGWRLLVDRDALVSQFDGWSTVKHELLSLEQEIDVEPLIRQAMNSLRRINAVSSHWNSTGIADALRDFEEMRNHFELQRGRTVPIVYGLPTPSEDIVVGTRIDFEGFRSWEHLGELVAEAELVLAQSNAILQPRIDNHDAVSGPE